MVLKPGARDRLSHMFWVSARSIIGHKILNNNNSQIKHFIQMTKRDGLWSCLPQGVV